MTKNHAKLAFLILNIVAVLGGLVWLLFLPGHCEKQCQECDPTWEAYMDWGTYTPCKCKDAEGNLKVP